MDASRKIWKSAIFSTNQRYLQKLSFLFFSTTTANGRLQKNLEESFQPINGLYTFKSSHSFSCIYYTADPFDSTHRPQTLIPLINTNDNFIVA